MSTLAEELRRALRFAEFAVDWSTVAGRQAALDGLCLAMVQHSSYGHALEEWLMEELGKDGPLCAPVRLSAQHLRGWPGDHQVRYGVDRCWGGPHVRLDCRLYSCPRLALLHAVVWAGKPSDSSANTDARAYAEHCNQELVRLLRTAALSADTPG
jgi:hypothetical protein